MNRLKHAIIFCAVLVIIFVNSCSKEFTSPEEVDLSVSYFFYPTSMGFWQEYQVDTFTFVKSLNDSFVTKDSFRQFFREELVDTLKTFDTPYQFRLRVWKKKTVSNIWDFYRNFSIQPLSNSILRNEDNLRFVKLVFPIQSQTNWKGNKYIDTSLHLVYGDWTYHYTNIYQPFDVNGFHFDSTIKVILYADSNAIEKTYFFEIYAKNIGLVYSEYQKLEKQNGANPWTLPENGFIVRRFITDWKK